MNRKKTTAQTNRPLVTALGCSFFFLNLKIQVVTNKSPTPAEAKFDTHFVLLVESFSPLLFSVYSLFASVRCILVDLIIWTSNQIKL